MSEDRSTINSTIKGKAYEYANVLAFVNSVEPIRPVRVIENSSLSIARDRYLNDISDFERSEMLASAMAGIGVILKMEPKILEDGVDPVELFIQPDNVAQDGDVRDVLVIRRDVEWEIGVSVKHNHEALKHSRLSERLDFGRIWLGLPTSEKYFASIRPIFSSLRDMKIQGLEWRALARKQEDVYLPVLNAFMDELKDLYSRHGDAVTSGLVKYLLGSNGSDYYKLIHHNNHRTRVIPFNLFGTLNQSGKSVDPETIIPAIELPTKILDLSLKEKSSTTVILTMNHGWAISFRLHNASSKVEPSLKFDIQLIGQPANLFYIDVAW